MNTTGLASLRRARGLSQKELGQRLGLTQSRVSAIESQSLGSLMLTTIARYVEGLGGHMSVRVVVDDKVYRMDITGQSGIASSHSEGESDSCSPD